MTFISAVIPVFNEAESLPELHRQFSKVCGEHNYEYELVFIDDGSTDNSWECIKELHTKDPASTSQLGPMAANLIFCSNSEKRSK